MRSVQDTAADSLNLCHHLEHGCKLMFVDINGNLISSKKLQLSIKAELENVTDLAPASDDFDWFFQVNLSPFYG